MPESMSLHQRTHSAFGSLVDNVQWKVSWLYGVQRVTPIRRGWILITAFAELIASRYKVILVYHSIYTFTYYQFCLQSYAL
jgi:hypothetical protein